MQLGWSNQYRARVWEFDGVWRYAIETPDAVGGWYQVSLGTDRAPGWPKWLMETYSIYEIKCLSEEAARVQAAEYLDQIRRAHYKKDAPKWAAERAEIMD